MHWKRTKWWPVKQNFPGDWEVKTPNNIAKKIKQARPGDLKTDNTQYAVKYIVYETRMKFWNILPLAAAVYKSLGFRI